MIESVLSSLFTLENLLWINVGLAGGIMVGALPGLTGTMAMALLLPLTYGLASIPGVMLLLGVYCGSIYGGSITAILINTPGTPASAATSLDGYPMAQKGHGLKALHVALSASTIGGLVRKLEPFEMLDEVLFTQVDSGQPISHIVLMGIGEPLDNFDNVMRFLELVNSPEGMNISMRHISLSTCGLVPRIDELAKRKLQLTLSVSLHAPNDRVRNTIMPVNKAYPTQELLDACRRYYAETSRRISFEYAMIDGVNDSVEDARELIGRLKGLPAHFNLIPLNHVEESPLKPSSKAAVALFQKTLEDAGIPATVRRTLGGDIDASCGQLRRKYTQCKQERKI